MKEDMMRKYLTMSAATAILCAASLVSIGAQAGSTTSRAAAKSDRVVAARLRPHVSTTRHATQPSGDITSFSSSSALNVGINHPAKK
jgi:hypothetical protein